MNSANNHAFIAVNELLKKGIAVYRTEEKINGNAKVMDSSKIENLKLIPSSDICFMFKFIDPVEKAYGHGHKLSEEIIQTLKIQLLTLPNQLQIILKLQQPQIKTKLVKMLLKVLLNKCLVKMNL